MKIELGQRHDGTHNASLGNQRVERKQQEKEKKLVFIKTNQLTKQNNVLRCGEKNKTLIPIPGGDETGSGELQHEAFEMRSELDDDQKGNGNTAVVGGFV